MTLFSLLETAENEYNSVKSYFLFLQFYYRFTFIFYYANFRGYLDLIGLNLTFKISFYLIIINFIQINQWVS